MRFCNHCGRLYDEHKGKCSCRKVERSIYKHESFYDGKRWQALAKLVKVRDYCADRLAMYLARSETPQDTSEDTVTYKLLRDYLIDATGRERTFSNRFFGNRFICHHIVPRQDDYSLQYNEQNLITVAFHTHEYIHQLYANGRKEKVQTILRNAVRAVLP